MSRRSCRRIPRHPWRRAFRTCTGGDDQRHHAHDEGERSHQDRAQAKPACLDGRLKRRSSLEFQFPGEFHDQDRVFSLRDRLKDDKADLRKDVVIPSRQPDAREGCEHAERDGQDDRDQQGRAFMRSEHEIDEGSNASEKTTMPIYRRESADRSRSAPMRNQAPAGRVSKRGSFRSQPCA